MLASLREQEKAPRTIRNIYSTLRSLFTDLIDEDIVDDNPCDVQRKHLGPAGDMDPEWRASARLGEVAGMCGRHWQTAEPSSKLVAAHSYKNATKTDTPREVPVHPLLELVLQGWRERGFETTIGWAPRPDDPIVPSPRSTGGNGAHRHRKAGTMRTKNQVGKRFVRDLEILGIPHRRLHDARRTFISLAQADGAQREHLLPVTHSSRRSRAAFDLYTTIPWSTRCEAVASFRPVPPRQLPRVGEVDPGRNWLLRSLLRSKPSA
jgi:integrase